MKIALVHDYLREYGGAERVLEALHELYPEAPVYVAFVDKKALGIHYQNFQGWDIRETWMANLPFIKKLFSPYRVFAARAFASLDLSNYDLVISSSNAYMAKAVKAKKQICYCHTPPRALYGYSTMSGWKDKFWTRIVGELINHYMRLVDFKVAQQVDLFIANSREVQERIKKFYRRDSVVIYPPVNMPDLKNLKFEIIPQRGIALWAKNYFLYVNRLALAKHPELAVKASIKLKLNLKVVGAGPMLADLKQLAAGHPNISFYGAVNDETLRELYSNARALLYPVEDEDFGIVPVEAMSYGLPVVAHRSGGPQETILENKTGVFFDKLTESDLIRAIDRLDKIKFSKKLIMAQAQKFGKERFKREIKKLVKKYE